MTRKRRGFGRGGKTGHDNTREEPKSTHIPRYPSLSSGFSPGATRSQSGSNAAAVPINDDAGLDALGVAPQSASETNGEVSPKQAEMSGVGGDATTADVGSVSPRGSSDDGDSRNAVDNAARSTLAPSVDADDAANTARPAKDCVAVAGAVSPDEAPVAGPATAEVVPPDDLPDTGNAGNVVDSAAPSASAPLANGDDAGSDARAADKEELVAVRASEDPATGEPTVPTSDSVSNETAANSGAAGDRALPNGDEHDVRMAEIAEVFDHAATPLLERCALLAEWVHHAEAKLQSRGQLEQKPHGGRPVGGILWAARELHLPGTTVEARRQFIRRAITISTLWPETRAAVREARLDQNQSALLFIAKGNSAQKQLDKTQEFLARRAAGPHGRRKTPEAESAARLAPATSDPLASTGPTDEVLSDDERADLAALQHTWDAHRVLPRVDWERASPKVGRQFVLYMMAAPPHPDDDRKTSAPQMFDDSSETQAKDVAQDADGEHGAE